MAETTKQTLLSNGETATDYYAPDGRWTHRHVALRPEVAEGAEAFKNGAPLDCPYDMKRQFDAFMAWHDGYSSAMVRDQPEAA